MTRTIRLISSGAMLYLFPTLALAADHPGKAAYDSVCAACHASGVMNAPKVGQTAKWKKLAKEGFDDLVGNALVGVRAMPAKGGKVELSDMQVAQAVHYMVTASGARFPEPTETKVRAARAEGEKRAAKRAAKK
jgi:cytochrome c5